MMTGTSRHSAHCTTAKIACGKPSFAMPRTNCGPTAYPTAKRNIRNTNALSGCAIVMPICPINTPASSVAVTAPRPMPLKVNLPKKYPSASVRKIAISGYVLRVVANHAMAVSGGGASFRQHRKLGDDVHEHRAPRDDQHVADGVGHRVAEHGDLALRRLLRGQQRRRVGAGAAADADQHPAVDVGEELLADQERPNSGDQYRDDARDQQRQPERLESRDERQAGAQAHDGDERVQA